jgi:hypothetical protein
VLFAIAARRVDSRIFAVVGVGAGSTTGAGVGAGSTTGAGVGETTGAGFGVAEGVGLAATFTPLFQTSLFPDLTQVYLIPFTVEVKFSFEQVSPGLTAALATFKLVGKSKIAEQRTARNDFPLLMSK